MLHKISSLLAGLLLICILYLNFQLYYQPSWSKTAPRINLSLYAQLKYLKSRLHAGAAYDMQKIYPEGYLFLNALYGLSWCNFTGGQPLNSVLYKEGIQEIKWALREVEKPLAKTPFSPNLPLPHGAFYNGWSNYLRAKYLDLLPRPQADTTQWRIYQDNCTQIAELIAQSETPFLESYIYASWPADMVVLMAALAEHDRLTAPKYQDLLQKWMLEVDEKTDQLGLIPHAVHPYTGKTLEAARGSSQSLILNFLLEIDSAYAWRKFPIYKKHFLAYRFGLPGVREYPRGNLGFGDIDSGPVLLGIGGAASIVGQRTMALYGENEVAEGLRNSIEAFGVGMKWKGRKCYLFGALPIADGFIAWANSLESQAADRLESEQNWRWGFQLGSVVVLGLIFGMRFRKPKRHNGNADDTD